MDRSSGSHSFDCADGSRHPDDCSDAEGELNANEKKNNMPDAEQPAEGNLHAPEDCFAVSGGDIYRHHDVPRNYLSVPQENSFPMPFETHCRSAEIVVDENWNVEKSIIFSEKLVG